MGHAADAATHARRLAVVSVDRVEGRRGRRARLLTGVVVVVALAGVAVNVWRPTAPPLLGTPTDLTSFPPEVLARVAAYRAPQRLVGLASLSLSVLVPVLLLVVPTTRRRLARLAEGRRPGLRAALAVGVVLVVTDLVTLPLDAWVGWLHERAFGFASGSFSLWLRDRAVSVAVTGVGAGVAAAALLWVVRRAPGTWDRWLVLLATLAAGVLVLLQPLVVQPLFLRTAPLPDGPTREAVEQVLAAAGERGLAIEVGDASTRTTRVNAFVTGLGPSRRVVLYDNLLELPAEQVAYVVAHELAHRQHRDLPRGVLLTAAAGLPLAWLLRRLWEAPPVRRALGQPDRASPLLAVVGLAVLVVTSVLGAPLGNAVSRRAEAAADHRALELTGDPVVQLALNRTFVTRDLADPTPPTWVWMLWGTHPTVRQRIQAAVDHAVRTGAPLPSLDALEGA